MEGPYEAVRGMAIMLDLGSGWCSYQKKQQASKMLAFESICKGNTNSFVFSLFFIVVQEQLSPFPPFHFPPTPAIQKHQFLTPCYGHVSLQNHRLLGLKRALDMTQPYCFLLQMEKLRARGFSLRFQRQSTRTEPPPSFGWHF